MERSTADQPAEDDSPATAGEPADGERLRAQSKTDRPRPTREESLLLAAQRADRLRDTMRGHVRNDWAVQREIDIRAATLPEGYHLKSVSCVEDMCNFVFSGRDDSKVFDIMSGISKELSRGFTREQSRDGDEITFEGFASPGEAWPEGQAAAKVDPG